MSVMGQTRHFGRVPVTSGPPLINGHRQARPGMSRGCHKETRTAQQRVFSGPRNGSIENRRQIGALRFAVESDAHKRHLENQVQAVFQAP